MLQLRYNGCAQCLSTAKAVLRNIGLFGGRDYEIEYHDAHRQDKIYTKRKDYLDIFSGAIMYNPETGHWIDFYSPDHERLVLKTNTEQEKETAAQLIRDLAAGK